jgi:hypothetical protein
VQAFLDVEIGGRLRLNGLLFMRNGNVKPGQLTPLIHGRRSFMNYIEIIDEDLRQRWTEAIRAAINEHLKTLPPEERMKPRAAAGAMDRSSSGSGLATKPGRCSAQRRKSRR